jgi:hypothetical protein
VSRSARSCVGPLKHPPTSGPAQDPVAELFIREAAEEGQHIEAPGNGLRSRDGSESTAAGVPVDREGPLAGIG